MPVDNGSTSTGGLAASAMQLTQISGLLGNISGADATVRRSDWALAVLQSRQFALDFVKQNKLTVKLFAGYYDKKSGNTEIDPEKYNSKSGKWLRKNNLGLEAQPTDDEIAEKFQKVFWVERDDKTNLLQLGVDWINPKESQEWLTKIVSMADEVLRKQSIQETEDNIQFLAKELQKSSLQEQKDAISQIYLIQLRNKMLESSTGPYFFRVLDPPNLPEKKSWPPRLLFTAIGVALGLIIGILLGFSHYYRKTFLVAD